MTIASNPRDKLHNVHGRLFQARRWREYAMQWDLAEFGISREWVRLVLRVPRAECLRRARVNLYLAHRLNRVKPCQLSE